MFIRQRSWGGGGRCVLSQAVPQWQLVAEPESFKALTKNFLAPARSGCDHLVPRTQHPCCSKFGDSDSGGAPVHVWGQSFPWLLECLRCTPNPQLAKPCPAFRWKAAHGQDYIRVAMIYEGWGNILHCLQCSSSFFAFFTFMFHIASLCFLKSLLMDCGNCHGNLQFGGRGCSWETVTCVVDAGQCPSGCQAQQHSCSVAREGQQFSLQNPKDADPAVKNSSFCWMLVNIV